MIDLKKILSAYKLDVNGIYQRKKDISQEYTKNFGIQWNVFSKTQLDSNTDLEITYQRLKKDIGNDPELFFKNKVVLEVGCGAGRFTEIISKYAKLLISVDSSDAVYACKKVSKKDNTIIIKDSIYDLDIKNLKFDVVICLGVLQHTPKINETIIKCVEFLSKNGNLIIDQYSVEWLPSPYFTWKYIYRIITTKINPKILLKLVKIYINIYFPFAWMISNLKGGIFILGLIPLPIWIYRDKNLSYEEGKEWAILDTYDAFGAKFDKPTTKLIWRNRFKKLGLKLKYIKTENGHGGLVQK